MKTSKMRSPLIRFLSFIKPYWHFVSVASVAGVLRYIIPLSVPWAVKIIVDDVLTGSLSHENLNLLFWLVGGLFAAYLVWMIASYLRLYFTGLVENRIVFDVRHHLFLHVQKMSLNFFERRKIGSVVSRMIHDINVAQDLVGYGVTATLMDLSSVVVIAAIMVYVHWELALSLIHI